jgi:hypothetical protein
LFGLGLCAEISFRKCYTLIEEYGAHRKCVMEQTLFRMEATAMALLQLKKLSRLLVRFMAFFIFRFIFLPDGQVSEAVSFVECELCWGSAGFGKFQMGILTYTGLAWLADAAEMILLSFIGPAVLSFSPCQACRVRVLVIPGFYRFAVKPVLCQSIGVWNKKISLC